ncbi:hypothetical protein [Agrobacterium radiobacter]|uniref:hypothetical protein n=1 Tax=Agrobacterium radiobacter TaxID=362 RepID=UPI003CE57D72
MTTALTAHQMMFMGDGIPRSAAGRLIGFLASPIKRSVPLSRFTTAADILAVVDREGEGGLENLGVPPELREGATLEVWSGGSKWGSLGVISHWERRADDWFFVRAETKKMGGGPDIGKLVPTRMQATYRADEASRRAYAIRARWSGDRDD